VTDFEAAVSTAVRKLLPDVTLRGCAFHWWSQAINRKVGELGLQVNINSISEII